MVNGSFPNFVCNRIDLWLPCFGLSASVADTDPHLKRPSGSTWRDPDPEGKKSLENVQIHSGNSKLEYQK